MVTANKNEEKKNDKNSSNFKIIAYSIKMMMMVIFGETKHENRIVMVRHYNCDKVHAILLSELNWIEFIHLNVVWLKKEEKNATKWCDATMTAAATALAAVRGLDFKRMFINSIEMS